MPNNGQNYCISTIQAKLCYDTKSITMTIKAIDSDANNALVDFSKGRGIF